MRKNFDRTIRMRYRRHHVAIFNGGLYHRAPLFAGRSASTTCWGRCFPRRAAAIFARR
jgi:hypothetical protein